MKFDKDWIKKNDMELKNFHECEREESCVLDRRDQCVYLVILIIVNIIIFSLEHFGIDIINVTDNVNINYCIYMVITLGVPYIIVRHFF